MTNVSKMLNDCERISKENKTKAVLIEEGIDDSSKKINDINGSIVKSQKLLREDLKLVEKLLDKGIYKKVVICDIVLFCIGAILITCRFSLKF